MKTKNITTITTGKAKELQELLIKGYSIRNTELGIKLIETGSSLQEAFQKAIQDSLEILSKTKEAGKAEEYDKKRIAILEIYADKDEKGNFIFKQLQTGEQAYTYTVENAELRDKELTQLSIEYKDLLADVQKAQNELATKEFDFETKITIEDINQAINTIKDLSANDILILKNLERYF